jgi:hypothetical protein
MCPIQSHFLLIFFHSLHMDTLQISCSYLFWGLNDFPQLLQVELLFTCVSCFTDMCEVFLAITADSTL